MAIISGLRLARWRARELFETFWSRRDAADGSAGLAHGSKGFCGQPMLVIVFRMMFCSPFEQTHLWRRWRPGLRGLIAVRIRPPMI